MRWNYRVFHTCHSVISPGQSVVHSYSLREVHYSEDHTRVVAIAATSAWPGGETLAELGADLARMAEALGRPVLTPAHIPGYVYAPYEVPLPPQEEP